MPLPKGFIKKVKFINQNVGPEKRQDFLDDIDYKGSYLPKGVDYEDIDKTFIDFVDEDLVLEIDGESVPVIFLTIQRWAEFSKTWAFSDKFKNFKMPFITIVRQPDIQVGTNQAGIWNIPGKPLYTYMKVPTFIDGRKGMDTYKIPQPTSVDVTYEVRFFCNRMKDLNKLHKVVQTTFNSRQFYITVNGHPMPIHLERIGDESQIDDFDSRRFYVQHFEMKVLGYILDEDDFEHIPAINRANIKFTELIDKTKLTRNIKVNYNLNGNAIEYKVIFEPNSEISVNVEMVYDINFTDVQDIRNLGSVSFFVNDNAVNLPFSVNGRDILTIIVDKDNTITGSFLLNGNIL